MNIDKEREAFEEWVKTKGWDTKRYWLHDEIYESVEVGWLWEAWQARAALDEQKAGPSDDELSALYLFADGNPFHLWLRKARALLSKYAAPTAEVVPYDHNVRYGDGFHDGYLKGRQEGYDAAIAQQGKEKDDE